LDAAQYVLLFQSVEGSVVVAAASFSSTKRRSICETPEDRIPVGFVEEACDVLSVREGS
jgi:hypothetical protein